MKRTQFKQAAPLIMPLAQPYFRPRRLVREINFHLKVAALACVAVGVATTPALAFEPVVQLSSLNGSTGFRLDSATLGEYSGYSVSAAGDVNGDGIDDLLIGAYGADPNGSDSGSSYVVFGRRSAFASIINLSSLGGGSGFRLDGVSAGDNSGRAVSAAGDVNGDGIDDLLIGAFGADTNGSYSGSSYVVFGAKDIAEFFCVPVKTKDGAITVFCL